MSIYRHYPLKTIESVTFMHSATKSKIIGRLELPMIQNIMTEIIYNIESSMYLDVCICIVAVLNSKNNDYHSPNKNSTRSRC